MGKQVDTPRAQKLAKLLVENQFKDVPSSKGAVLRAAGYSEQTSKHALKEIISQASVQRGIAKEIKTMAAAMKKKGITPEFVAERIKTLLQAEVKVETFKKGELQTSITREDSYAIDKGINHALRLGLGGGYKDQPLPASSINIWGNDAIKALSSAFESGLKELISNQIKPVYDEESDTVKTASDQSSLAASIPELSQSEPDESESPESTTDQSGVSAEVAPSGTE